MTLVAVEPDPEEKVGRVLHRLLRGPEDLVVRRRRVLPVRPARGDDLPHELVVRGVRRHLLANP